MRNAKRLQLDLALVRAFHAGQADLATFSAVVKRQLRALPPEFRFNWRLLRDPRGQPCSIAQLIVEAHNLAAQGTATYMAAAKTRSVMATIAEMNEQLAALGHPPLVATVSPGRRTASVKVTGLMLERD